MPVNFHSLKFRDVIKILLTNWMHLTAIYLSFYLTIIISKLLGQPLESWISVLFVAMEGEALTAGLANGSGTNISQLWFVNRLWPRPTNKSGSNLNISFLVLFSSGHRLPAFKSRYIAKPHQLNVMLVRLRQFETASQKHYRNKQVHLVTRPVK